jgi:hypothetical protein
MKEERLPYPDAQSETISPDVAGAQERPLKPSEAVKREEERYGESSLNENRGDQWDEHHGEVDDIV